MYIGSGVGPAGTCSKYGARDPFGPHVQLQKQDRAAECRPDLDRFALGLNLGTEVCRSAE